MDVERVANVHGSMGESIYSRKHLIAVGIASPVGIDSTGNESEIDRLCCSVDAQSHQKQIST